MAFYVVRGWKISDLLELSATEKIFMRHAQKYYWEEEFEKYKALFGEKGVS
ncbi:hypothetical protein CBY_2544 [Clostridium butyricum 5521]|nr:hypothetical protein CBY_2544 [Clostridium butyricum 5521]